MESIIKDYLTTLREEIANLPVESIEEMSELLSEVYENNKSVFVMGNGGSSANASHFVCDLVKGLSYPGGKRFRALSLCDNTPLLTATANDCGYENVFCEQLENFLQSGDLVIAVSGSGNSRNVVRGIELARKKKAITVGVLGSPGGMLKDMVDLAVVAPSENLERIEDLHSIIFHSIKTRFIGEFKKEL